MGGTAIGSCGEPEANPLLPAQEERERRQESNEGQTYKGKKSLAVEVLNPINQTLSPVRPSAHRQYKQSVAAQDAGFPGIPLSAVRSAADFFPERTVFQWFWAWAP